MAGPILFLHPSDEAYGADRILLELVDAAIAEGRPVAVLLADDLPPGWLSRNLLARGVPHDRVALAPARRRYLRLAGLPGYMLAILRARRIVRRRAIAMGASIIHVNTAAVLAGLFVGRPGGAALAWHAHEIVGRSPLEWILFRLAPVLVAGRVIAVSGAVARRLAPGPLARNRVVIVRNGLPDRPPPPNPSGPTGESRASPASSHSAATPPGPVIAYVGRLNRWKGYDVFVAAAGLLVASGVPARFVIAGDAPPGEEWRRNDLVQRVRAVGISAVTQILGHRDDPETVIEAADIIAVPSTLPDPFPTVILEAMRAGRPVVASAHGGIPEMVVDGETGLLVRPDDPAALADAFRRLIMDAELRAQLGEAGRTRFLERFSQGRFRAAIGAVWRSME